MDSSESPATKMPGIYKSSNVSVSTSSISIIEASSSSLSPCLAFFASFSAYLLASSSSEVSINDEVNYDCIEILVLSAPAFVAVPPSADAPGLSCWAVAVAAKFDSPN